MITAISWPTALTIRHSRFATLTLAKLVASLALHPPISATEADYAPHHRLRRSLSSRRSLFKYAFQLLLIAAQGFRTQPAPRGTPMQSARAGEARPRGKSEGLTGRSLLQTRQHKVFTCHGGGQGHSQFKTSSFSVHNTGSLLLSSLKKVTYPSSPRPPSSPLVPLPSPIVIILQ